MDILISFIFFVTVTLIMTVGLWFGRKPIAGTCGGLNNVSNHGNGESVCAFCGKNANQVAKQLPCAGDGNRYAPSSYSVESISEV